MKFCSQVGLDSSFFYCVGVVWLRLQFAILNLTKNEILEGHNGCVESFLLLKTGQKHNFFIEMAGKPVLN